MKTFTYVAAIALFAAGTAFAQSSPPNGSTINNSTPTPSAVGPAEGTGTSSTNSSRMSQPGSINQSGSANMNKSGSTRDTSSMNQSSMDRSSDMASTKAAKAKSHHVARNRGADARENQETQQLNRQQIAGNSASMAPSGGMGYSGGMRSSGAGNPFDNGSPQQAQGGGANCSPDNPSCGTARQNPAINSSPQHRTYGDQQ